MRRLIVLTLAALGVFAASGGLASTAAAQAGGWQIPGASTEVRYSDFEETPQRMTRRRG